MAARRWPEAAEAWEQVALSAQGSAQREAWEAAGECWRRADRPARAARALEMALGLPQPDAQRASGRARLAGVLGELGEGVRARRVAEEALAHAEGGARALVVDTLISTHLGFGRKAAARPLLDELRELDRSGLAVGFRQGQLQRLDGELDAAEVSFRAVERALDGQPGAEAGRAAAHMELAELDCLRGAPALALGPYEDGRRLHAEAGRRALAWRCEAGRVRAAVEAGLPVLSPILDEGLREAVDHDLRLLEVDLRLARGMARAARDASGADEDLARAGRAAKAMGCRLREGRACLERAQRGVHLTRAVRQELLARARVVLEDHVVLHRRALEVVVQ